MQDQLLSVAAFWLDMGVDGFRLDAVNFCTHDPALRDNPPLKPGERPTDGVSPDNPYAYQRHLYDKTQPETPLFLKRLRRLTDSYAGRATVGEISGDDSLLIAGEYTRGDDCLNMAYTFNLLTPDFSAEHLRQVVGAMEAAVQDGWPCWAFSNHDVTRVVSRWGTGADGADDADFARLLMALLLSLRGSVCLYQGEELGLPEAEVPYEQLQDPYGKAFWPEFKGRDGCRTPMPWQGGDVHGGFSATTPWLPVDPRHLARAVDRQEGEAGSLLKAYRGFLAWRRRQPALCRGSVKIFDTGEPLVVLARESAEQRLLCVFNCGGAAQRLALAPWPGITAIDDGAVASTAQGTVQAGGEGAVLHLPRFGVFFGSLDGSQQKSSAKEN